MYARYMLSIKLCTNALVAARPIDAATSTLSYSKAIAVSSFDLTSRAVH